MSSSEIIAGFVGFIVGVASIVVGERLTAYFNRLKMKVTIAPYILSNTPVKHSETIGFGITIEQGKELNEAYVKFNNKIYPWIEDGVAKAKTKLFVGEDPSWISIYYLNLSYIEDISKSEKTNIHIISKGNPSNHAVLLSAYEIDPAKNTAEKKIFERIIIIPKNGKSVNIAINKLLSKIYIRLIAEGIEKKMKYSGDLKIQSLSIGKLENGVPSLDTASINLILLYD
jgi:hypothetical protein